MITTAALLFCSLASAQPSGPGAPAAPSAPATPSAPAAKTAAPAAPSAPAPKAPAPPSASSRMPAASAVHASTAAAPSAASALGVSTYTVSTLYTGDKVRDPFLPPSVGGSGARARDRNAPLAVDIHTLELRGIMKDTKSDFAIFSMDGGGTLILRGVRLYDDRGKVVPGITGNIKIKQKRAELITADKDVQIYSLGEPDAGKTKDAQPNDNDQTGSGRSP